MRANIRRSAECVIAVMALGSLLLCFAPVCSGEEKPKRQGAEIYQQYCSTCHVAGGNTAKPGKPIAGSKVLRSIATFQKYLEDPPGHMPYYKTVVSDKTIVKKLFEYCRTFKKTEGA